MIVTKLLYTKNTSGSNRIDDLGADTGCGWAFIVNESNMDLLEDVKQETHTIQTLTGKTEYQTQVGRIGGERALVTDSNFNLLGVGRLMASLGDSASFEGNSEKMVLKYGGKEFWTAHFRDDYVPWGSLSELITSLENILDENESIERTELNNKWKSFITLRDRDNLTNWKNKSEGRIEENNSNNHNIQNSNRTYNDSNSNNDNNKDNNNNN